MSTHPNAILLLTLTPDDLSRKTWKNILQESKVWRYQEEGVIDFEGQIKIYGNDYSHKVMESNYNESMQISASEGDIVVYDMVTYGYGEVRGSMTSDLLFCIVNVSGFVGVGS